MHAIHLNKSVHKRRTKSVYVQSRIVHDNCNNFSISKSISSDTEMALVPSDNDYVVLYAICASFVFKFSFE